MTNNNNLVVVNQSITDDALSSIGIRECFHSTVKRYFQECFDNIIEGSKQQASIVIINKGTKEDLINGVEFEIKYNINKFHSKTRELVWDDIMEVGNKLWSMCDILENQIIESFKAEFEKQF